MNQLVVPGDGQDNPNASWNNGRMPIVRDYFL